MDDADVTAHLRAGAALYADGYYHAAHDPWEAAWLSVREDSTADAALFQGLIQTTAALYHAREGNLEGAAGLAESAREYLEAVPPDHRAVDLDPLPAFLDRLPSDPAADPPPLRIEGRTRSLADLEFPAAAVAAPALAEAEGFDPGVPERAARYARADLAESPTSRFVDALLSFVAAGERGAPRGVAYDRLRRRVERRDAKERDVAGLF